MIYTYIYIHIYIHIYIYHHSILWEFPHNFSHGPLYYQCRMPFLEPCPMMCWSSCGCFLMVFPADWIRTSLSNSACKPQPYTTFVPFSYATRTRHHLLMFPNKNSSSFFAAIRLRLACRRNVPKVQKRIRWYFYRSVQLLSCRHGSLGKGWVGCTWSLK